MMLKAPPSDIAPRVDSVPSFNFQHDTSSKVPTRTVSFPRVGLMSGVQVTEWQTKQQPMST